MRREGHFIENVWFKGGWGDEYQYALLEREWRARPRAAAQSSELYDDDEADAPAGR